MRAPLQTKAKTSSSAPPTFAPVRRGLLQRKCACGGTPGPTGECEACRKKKLQRAANHPSSLIPHPSEVPSIVHEVLRSPGQPLDTATRSFMEPLFGHDFSRVRVHNDARAQKSAQAVNALAYTVGRDIVFGAGQYAPESRTGQRLVAHELAHSIQQATAPALDNLHSAALKISSPTDSSEQIADQLAERVAIGSVVAPSVIGEQMLQRYGDPIPTVANPSVVTMTQFIGLVKRIEAANAGMTALQIAQMIMRTKYHSQGFDYLLPSSAGGKQVTAGKAVTGADVTTLSGEFEVALPQGGQSDPSHVVTAIVAGAETQSPGAGGAGGLSGKLIQALPKGLSQRDVATWVGDVASAAAEWQTAHPHPKGGQVKQDYMDEYAPESDLIADIDGVVMASKKGFAFDPLGSLSMNLEAFYFPTGVREGKNRRFHTFCSFEGLGLQTDGLTLNAGGMAAIASRVRLNTEWFEHNDPNLISWVVLQGEGLFNPIRDAWIERANDWHWFSEKFQGFVQRNLKSEGA